MLEKYNRYRVLKVFLDAPIEQFRLREISRMSQISPASVMNYLKAFEKEGVIQKHIKRGIPFYVAVRDHREFIFYKKISVLFELHASGIVDYLWEKLSPEAIILYGSSARGESTEYSDIDLFVIGKGEAVSVQEFEDKIGKKIHLIIERSFAQLPKALKNNLLNGIVLRGYLKVF